MPKVSVIIPTYNRAKFLSLALASVLNQTFQDFEIIIVDDNSQDNTQEFVTDFDDKRIKYIRHETNKGVAASRNTGVISSDGEYIAFLDDDDEWLPHKLEVQVDLLEKSSSIIGAVYSGAFKVESSNGNVLAQHTPKKRGDVFNEMIVGNCAGPTSTLLLRRECFEKVGLFDVNIGFGEDYDMWLRISQGYHFDYIEEPLVRYSIQNNGLSNNYEIRLKGAEALLSKHEQLYETNRKNYSYRYFSIGVLYCYNGNIKRGREIFFKAVKLYPFEIRYYYNLCLSLLGVKAFKKFKEIRDKIPKMAACSCNMKL